MNQTKRIILTTVLGLISGTIAVGLVSLGSGGLPPEITLRMRVSVGFMGFVIGPLLLIGFNSAKEAGIIKFKFKI